MLVEQVVEIERGEKEGRGGERGEDKARERERENEKSCLADNEKGRRSRSKKRLSRSFNGRLLAKKTRALISPCSISLLVERPNSPPSNREKPGRHLSRTTKSV